MKLRRSHRPRLVPPVLLCLLCTAAVFQTDSPLAGATERTLDNGLKLIVREQRDAPLVAIDLWIRAGSADEAPGGAGAAHFLEHLVFKGTPSRGPGVIDAAFEDVGSSLNAATTRRATHFFATVAPPYLAGSLEVLADAVANPILAQDELDRERAIIQDESARTNNDWRRIAREAAWKAIYGDAPFARPVLGSQEAIAALDRRACLEFHRRWYVPNNALLVVVGAETPATIRQAAAAAFAGWKPQPLPDDRSFLKSESVSREARLKSDRPDSISSIAVRLPETMTESESIAAEMLAVILGDERGGRIPRSLRKADKSVESGAESSALRCPNIFIIYAKSQSADADVSIRTVNAELDRLLADGVNEGDAEWARRKLMGAYLFEAETYAGQARLLGERAARGGFKQAVNYMDSVRAVSAAQLNEFARAFLPTAKRVSVALKPQ